MSSVEVAGTFVREHLRARMSLVLLVAIPALFVLTAASVLGQFSRALGGSVAGNAASALGAGWSAAFLAGALGYFQVASSRAADRRLALAGLGAARVALARIGASLVLGVTVAAVSYLTLWLRAGIAHPVHAALAILAFAAVYLAIGAIVGSIVADPLTGSMAVAFIFLLDVFSGPGMSDGGLLSSVTPTSKAANLLTAAGAGAASPGSDWLWSGAIVSGALIVAAVIFWLSARART